MTEFKPIKHFENYGVSTEGVVKNLITDKELKPTEVLGYLAVTLYNEFGATRKYISKLVAETYLENPRNFKHVSHKNNDIKDNRVENLEWRKTRNIILDEPATVPICQLDKHTGLLIKIYANASKAATYVAKRNIRATATSISQCLHKKRATAAGYRWCYISEYHFSREDF